MWLLKWVWQLYWQAWLLPSRGIGAGVLRGINPARRSCTFSHVGGRGDYVPTNFGEVEHVLKVRGCAAAKKSTEDELIEGLIGTVTEGDLAEVPSESGDSLVETDYEGEGSNHDGVGHEDTQGPRARREETAKIFSWLSGEVLRPSLLLPRPIPRTTLSFFGIAIGGNIRLIILEGAVKLLKAHDVHFFVQQDNKVLLESVPVDLGMVFRRPLTSWG